MCQTTSAGYQFPNRKSSTIICHAINQGLFLNLTRADVEHILIQPEYHLTIALTRAARDDPNHIRHTHDPYSSIRPEMM